MLHLGHGAARADRRGHRRPSGDADRVHQPQLAAVRLARRRPPPGGGARPRAARAHDGRPRAIARAEIRRRSRGSTSSTTASPAAPASSPTTRCAWRSTSAASPRAATSSPRCCARSTTSTSSCTARTCWSPCSGWPSGACPRPHGWWRRCGSAVERVGLEPEGTQASFATPPPWGELAMTPREAYLGAQEVVPAEEAVGRIAAESLATYPPGIPNVLPGERLTAETLTYIQRTLELGGSVRGASDRLLHTVRVVIERSQPMTARAGNPATRSSQPAEERAGKGRSRAPAPAPPPPRAQSQRVLTRRVRQGSRRMRAPGPTRPPGSRRPRCGTAARRRGGTRRPAADTDQRRRASPRRAEARRCPRATGSARKEAGATANTGSCAASALRLHREHPDLGRGAG